MAIKDSEIRKTVREGYASVAKQSRCGCSPTVSCCGAPASAEQISRAVGYSDEDMAAVPDGANLGLGCGNPIALATLKPGETVLDLGSGAGFDCFLAAKKVGDTGRVIGVDMTPEMLEKARENAAKVGAANVEFRMGEIEHLPVADASVDAIISNCVINLSPDKPQVFREAFRALKRGGRLMVSDVVLTHELPAAIRESVNLYVSCVSGAMLKADYLAAIRAAGFDNVKVVSENAFPMDLKYDDPVVDEVAKQAGLSEAEMRRLAEGVLSVKVSATRPA